MNLPLFDKEIENYIEEHWDHLKDDYQNSKGVPDKGILRARLHYLVRKAQPGNHQWNTLVHEFNWDADYIAGQDDGEIYSGHLRQ